VLELRVSVFRHVLRQPLAFFTRDPDRSLVSRLDDISVTQRVVGKRSERLVRQSMQLSGELSAMMTERSDVSGALLAMLYGRPDEDAGVFTRKASRVRDLTVASRAGMNLVVVFVTLLAALVTALVYGLGGTLVMNGVFQLGTLVAFIALVSQLYGPLNTMSSLPVEVLTALVSFDRVFEILDLEPLR
jgi:ATP-binding cassette subfamily B protein